MTVDHAKRLREAWNKASKARVELAKEMKAARAAGLSLREISAASGYSHEQVRQITSGVK